MYWYRDVTSFRRELRNVRWQRFDEGNDDTDLDMGIDDSSLGWDVQAKTEERHLLSYTNVRAIEGKIYNLVEAHGPDAAFTWKHLFVKTMHTVLLNRLPVFTGTIPISDTAEVSNASKGLLFQRGTKSRKRSAIKPARGRPRRPRGKRGGIMKTKQIERHGASD